MRPVLTHVALHVKDLDATVRFYETMCELHCFHRRGEVAWLAEHGREHEFIMVLISGGPMRSVQGNDFSHLGFALESREAVELIAQRGEAAGCLAWRPRQESYPVGYYCALRDPDGNYVEFSYGQPLGPGAEALDESLVPRGSSGY